MGWWGFRLDANYQGRPLQIADRVFERGLYAHAHSEVGYLLDGKYERFEAWIGISHTEGKAGSVRFMVLDEPDLLRRLH